MSWKWSVKLLNHFSDRALVGCCRCPVGCVCSCFPCPGHFVDPGGLWVVRVPGRSSLDATLVGAEDKDAYMGLDSHNSMRRGPEGRNRYQEVVGVWMVWKVHSLECSLPEEVLAESPGTEAVAAPQSTKDSGADTVPNRVPGETVVEVRMRR